MKLNKQEVDTDEEAFPPELVVEATEEIAESFAQNILEGVQ